MSVLTQEHERSTWGSCIGVDEVGVGCSAGSLWVCAIYLDPDFHMTEEEKKVIQVKDSKAFRKGTECKRTKSAKWFQAHPHVHYSLVEFTPPQVDELNPRAARLQGFLKSVQDLIMHKMTPEQVASLKYILIDGNIAPPELNEWLLENKLDHIKIETIVKGDAHSFSIASASIVAKTVRDAQIMELHEMYPQYGFDKHKGYCHLSHKLALEKYGFTPYHRRTYNMNLTAKEKLSLQSKT